MVPKFPPHPPLPKNPKFTSPAKFASEVAENAETTAIPQIASESSQSKALVRLNLPVQQQQTGRQKFRAASSRRQTRVFTTVITLLIVCLGIGVVGAIIPIPYTGFAETKNYAKAGQTPCPVPGTTMTPTAGVQVTVLNGTSQPGLASSVATSLETLGYTISSVDNSPSLYRGNIQIEAGPNGVDDAYTLGMYFTGGETTDTHIAIVLTETTTNSLTVIIGDQFEKDSTEKAIAAAQEYTGELVAFDSDCYELDTSTLDEEPQSEP